MPKTPAKRKARVRGKVFAEAVGPDTRPPMPEGLRQMAQEAIAKHLKRPSVPRVIDRGDDSDGWRWECPYAEEDSNLWQALLFEMFATRQCAVVDTFFDQLAALCPNRFCDKAQDWRVDVEFMRTLIAMVGAMKPRNEAEAAYAAQLCAVHTMTMRLAEGAGRMWIGERTASVISKAVRTYGDGLLTFQRLHGKGGRKSKQTIKVSKHVHNHQHVHFEGGSGDFGGQPHRPTPALVEELRQVPGANATRDALPIASDARQKALPNPRRKGGRPDGGE